MKPNCHRSSARATHPELLANSSLFGPHWQLKGAVGAEVASDAVRTLTVIQSGAQGIGVAVTRLYHCLAEAIGGHQAEAMSRPHRDLYLHGVIVAVTVIRGIESRVPLGVRNEIVLREASRTNVLTCRRIDKPYCRQSIRDAVTAVAQRMLACHQSECPSPDHWV